MCFVIEGGWFATSTQFMKAHRI